MRTSHGGARPAGASPGAHRVPAERQKFSVPPFLAQLAVMEHEDAVCIEDRGESVCNDQSRPSGSCARQRQLDPSLGLWIDRAGGLVQEENGRITGECARKREQLPFSHRERSAPLGDGVTQPSGQSSNERARSGGVQCGFKCHIIERPVKSEIPIQVAPKQKEVLRYEPDPLAAASRCSPSRDRPRPPGYVRGSARRIGAARRGSCSCRHPCARRVPPFPLPAR